MVPADSCWTGGINVTQNAIPDSLKGLYKFISDVGKSIFYISRILIWYIICRVMIMLQAFNILRYEIGQRYDSHYDAFNPAEYGPQKSQRVRPNQQYRFSSCQNCILIVYIMMLIWSSLHIYIIQLLLLGLQSINGLNQFVSTIWVFLSGCCRLVSAGLQTNMISVVLADMHDILFPDVM